MFEVKITALEWLWSQHIQRNNLPSLHSLRIFYQTNKSHCDRHRHHSSYHHSLPSRHTFCLRNHHRSPINPLRTIIMSVDIEPSELGFRRPFTQEVSETLSIKNTNSTPVAFKVRTYFYTYVFVRSQLTVQFIGQNHRAQAVCLTDWLSYAADLTVQQ